MSLQTTEQMQRSVRSFRIAVLAPAVALALGVAAFVLSNGGEGALAALGLVAGVLGVSWIGARMRQHRPDAWPRVAGWTGTIVGAIGAPPVAVVLSDDLRQNTLFVVVAVVGLPALASWWLARRAARSVLTLPVDALLDTPLEVPFRSRDRSGTVLFVGADEIRVRLGVVRSRRREAEATYAEVVDADLVDLDEPGECVIMGGPVRVPAGQALRLRIAHAWAEEGEPAEEWLVGTDESAQALRLITHRREQPLRQ